MFRRERLSGESAMMADWSLTAGLAQSDSRTSSSMCRRPSGTDCREQVSIKSGRPVAKKVGSAREAANSPRASVFVYNLSYGVLTDEAGRFPVTGNYTTTYQKANHFWLAFFLGRPMKNPKACHPAPVRVAGWAGLWRATQLDKRRLPFACPPEFQRRQAKAAQ